MALSAARNLSLVFLCVVSPLIGQDGDVWSPSMVNPDWQIVTKLQRVPLFDKEVNEALDLKKLLGHHAPIVRLTAASTIVQTKQESLYDNVLELCRDDWPFVADASFEFMSRMYDKNRVRRLMKVGAIPDWTRGRRSSPYSVIFDAAGLSNYVPSSYWQWHANEEVADYWSGNIKEVDKQHKEFQELIWFRDQIFVSLDRSVAKQGDTINCRVRFHRGRSHYQYDTRIHGCQFALEYGGDAMGFLPHWEYAFASQGKSRPEVSDYGAREKRWPSMQRTRRTEKREYIEEEYRISLAPNCWVGDYRLCRNSEHACFRVVRSEQTEKRLKPLIASGDLQDLFEAVELRSPLAVSPLKRRLDQYPRVTHEGKGEFEITHCWSALGMIGTERCAEILLHDDHEFHGTCMGILPRGALSLIGCMAHRPAMQALRSWEERDGETLAKAISALGSNALRNEHPLLKEIIIGQTELIKRRKPEVDRLRAEVEKKSAEEIGRSTAYLKLLKEYHQISSDHYRRIECVAAALSKFREDEREFVLATILEFGHDPQALYSMIPSSFIQADAPWVVEQLWKQSKSRPDGDNIKKRLRIGLRNTGDAWMAPSE